MSDLNAGKFGVIHARGGLYPWKERNMGHTITVPWKIHLRGTATSGGRN